MVDPDGTLDALTSLALASPTTPKPKTSNGASKPSSTISPNRELPSPGLSRPQASGEASAITNKWKTGTLRIERTGPLTPNPLWSDRFLPVHTLCTPPFLCSTGMSIFFQVKLLKVIPVDLDGEIQCSYTSTHSCWWRRGEGAIDLRLVMLDFFLMSVWLMIKPTACVCCICVRSHPGMKQVDFVIQLRVPVFSPL